MRDGQTMMQYLKSVLDAELACYTFDAAIDRFEREKRKYERKPIVDRPSLGSTEFYDIFSFSESLIVSLLLWLAGFIVMVVIIGSSFETLRSSVSTDTIIFMLFGLPVFFSIICVIVFNYKHYYDIKQANEREMQRYDSEKAQAEKQIKQDKIKINKISQQIEQLYQGRAMARSQRQRLYDMNIIHKDYRNLVKISKMYEFFDIGICNELEGGLGAYAKCREEMKWDSMYDLLVEIKNDVTQLKGICYSLYNGISQSNRRLDALCDGMNQTLQSLSAIEHNSELAAYNSEIAANESRIQTNMMIYSDLIK